MNAQVLPVPAQTPAPVIVNCFPYDVTPKRRLRTREEFLQAARDVVPVLREHARKSTEIRRPANESVDALLSAGLIGLLRPKKFGGAELEVSDMVEVAGILAEGCGSTAWDYDVWESHNWILGMFPEKGQEEVFGTDNVVTCCGVANPTQAKARAVDGGYMLSGRWAFASGSTHSNWASVGAAIEGRQIDGRPEIRFMAVPRPAFQVLDTWKVRGLSGTGTHDLYIADEVFVPEHRTVTRVDIATGNSPGGKLHGGVAYRMPLVPAVHLATAATSIGAARAAIDRFKELTAKRTYVSGQKQMDNPAAMIRIGTALVELEGAGLLLQSVLRELEAEVRAGRTLTVEIRAKARMVAGYVPDVCKQIVNSLVSASGVSSLADSSPLSTILLDVTMMSLHQSTEYDRGPENYGRVVMGLAPSNPAI